MDELFEPTFNNEEVLAVDGDIVAYRTAAVCQDHFAGACDAILQSTLKDIATTTGISKMRIYLTGSNNFRYALAKTKPYKGNRVSMERPQFLGYCRDYLIENFNADVLEGFEADDGIATDMFFNGAVHCGIDKDILQIAGRHYNYVKKEWQIIDNEEAILRLYRQVLTGDTSDNIPGLPRVGAKTAEKVIVDPETALDDAISYYEEVCSAKLTETNYIEYMAEQLSLVKMSYDVKINYSKFTIVEGETEGFSSHECELAEDQPVRPKGLKL